MNSQTRNPQHIRCLPPVRGGKGGGAKHPRTHTQESDEDHKEPKNTHHHQTPQRNLPTKKHALTLHTMRARAGGFSWRVRCLRVSMVESERAGVGGHPPPPPPRRANTLPPRACRSFRVSVLRAWRSPRRPVVLGGGGGGGRPSRSPGVPSVGRETWRQRGRGWCSQRFRSRCPA